MRVLACGSGEREQLLTRDGVGFVRFVAREVHEVDALGAREEVDGEDEDDGGGREQHREQDVVM